MRQKLLITFLYLPGGFAETHNTLDARPCVSTTRMTANFLAFRVPRFGVIQNFSLTILITLILFHFYFLLPFRRTLFPKYSSGNIKIIFIIYKPKALYLQYLIAAGSVHPNSDAYCPGFVRRKYKLRTENGP